MHGYTKEELDEANTHTDLVMRVQKHLVRTNIRMLKHPRSYRTGKCKTT